MKQSSIPLSTGHPKANEQSGTRAANSLQSIIDTFTNASLMAATEG